MTCTFTNGPTGQLPATGGDSGRMMAVGALLIVAGLGLLAVNRRRPVITR